MAARGKSVGKLVATVQMFIPAGKAAPSPPLGPALGQVYDCWQNAGEELHVSRLLPRAFSH